MIRGSWCSESRLAKAAGAEEAVEQRNENGTPLGREAHFQVKMYKNTTCTEPSLKFQSGTPLWREEHFQVKMYKTPQRGMNFGSSDLGKWHAAVVRSAFVSQNAQTTTCSGHFLKLRCQKIARHCGAKHMCKSKCTKYLRFGTLLGRPMWKRCPTEEIDRLILNQSVSQSIR